MDIQLSVCCPIYNEDSIIADVVRRIIDDLGTLSLTWEIILWLDGCTDETASILEFEFKQNEKITIVNTEERHGKSYAINGLRDRAQGIFLIFTDSDVIWEKGVSNILISTLKKNEHIGLVAGRAVPNSDGKSMVSRIYHLSFKYWHLLREKQNQEDSLWAISGQIYAVYKRLLLCVPSYLLNEDAFIGKQIRSQGYKVHYAPAAVVFAEHPHTWGNLLLQKVRTRYGWIQLGAIDKKETIKVNQKIRLIIIEDILNTRQQIFEKVALLILDIVCSLAAISISFMPSYKINKTIWRKNSSFHQKA